ncbi:NADPH oxidase 5 [Nymphon striatum]|nr:NADPH oxidase 5 [Nymphon striatum]
MRIFTYTLTKATLAIPSEMIFLFRRFKVKDNFSKSNEYFSRRLFEIFDTDLSGTIEKEELVIAIGNLLESNSETKIKFLFDLCDRNGNNSIDHSELREVLKACFDENNVKFTEYDADCLVEALFKNCDANQDGTVSFDELKSFIMKYPGLADGLSFSVHGLFEPKNKSLFRDELKDFWNSKLTYSYFINNITVILLFLIIFGANLAIIIVTVCLQVDIMPVEKVTAIAAVFESAQNSMQSTSFFGTVLEQNMHDFGNISGQNFSPPALDCKACLKNLVASVGRCVSLNSGLVLLFMLRRTITKLRHQKLAKNLQLDYHYGFHKLSGWLILLFGLIHTITEYYYFSDLDYLKQQRDNSKRVLGTGLALFLILVLMVCCSQNYVRKGGHFQVIQLVIEKPENFTNFGGDYVYVNIPEIARNEWHPFTISSAVEEPYYFWLHIRAVGNWTDKLYNHFDRLHNKFKTEESFIRSQFARYNSIELKNRRIGVSKSFECKSITYSSELLKLATPDIKSDFQTKDFFCCRTPLKVFLDGPYGRPCLKAFNSEHAVLIGTGIGVTPFASILQSLLIKFNKKQTGISVNNQLNDQPDFNVNKGDMKAVLLQMALDIMYEDDEKDLLTGLKSRSHAGRPNWDEVNDTVLIADSAAQLQELINAVNESGKPYGMTMNVEKTKSMVISKVLPVPRINIMLETEAIKQTSSMVYLGHMVTEDGKNETEIKRRIGIAKDAFNNMANILTSRNLKTETKKRLVKCYIWSTLLYGAETWTLTKIMMTKIEAFEMWIYRRMLKISYTEHRTNEFVLRKIEAKRPLMNTIKKRKCTYFGHIMRKEDDLQRLLLEGKIQGRRGRGRPRTAWYHNIKEWTGMRYADCSRKAQNREEWRSMTANLLKADGTGDR